MSTPILGSPTITQEAAMCWAALAQGPLWFSLLAEKYWAIAPGIGVRPEVAWVQACHETGHGKFGRAVTREHNNFCGLKVPSPSGEDDNPDAHARFPTPEFGITAHLEHLALYAAGPGYPRSWTKISDLDWSGTSDSRHFGFIRGRAKTVEELGGNWAPRASYGTDLVRKLGSLLKYAEDGA